MRAFAPSALRFVQERAFDRLSVHQGAALTRTSRGREPPCGEYRERNDDDEGRDETALARATKRARHRIHGAPQLGETASPFTP